MVVTSRRREPRVRAAVEPLDSRAARVAALDSLARRDRCSGDLHRKLVEKGFDPGVVGGVIERLLSERLLDDHRYVENFVVYHANRGQGPLRLKSQLRQAGLQGDLIEEVIDAYPDWLAQLRQAHEKKFGMQPPTHYADRQRRSRFLSYRGFTGAQIRMALGFDTDLDVDD